MNELNNKELLEVYELLKKIVRTLENHKEEVNVEK